MKIFPASAIQQLELDKIKSLLSLYCKSALAKSKAEDLQIETRKELIEPLLQQAHEYKLLLQSHLHFPEEHELNLTAELKLLGIPGAVLSGEQFLKIKKLTENIKQIFRWFDSERRMSYPSMALVIRDTYYEKAVVEMINEVLNEYGVVRDDATENLSRIRVALYKKRNELRRLFDRIVSRLNKQGYLADIEESFMNNRRVLAVFAEQKRMVRGILHGESDSRRTAFIEPEETIDLNNQLHELENAERKEVYRILKQLTKQLSAYSALLSVYHTVVGEYDFIRAKAAFAIDIKGEYPLVS